MPFRSSSESSIGSSSAHEPVRFETHGEAKPEGSFGLNRIPIKIHANPKSAFCPKLPIRSRQVPWQGAKNNDYKHFNCPDGGASCHE
jgi:hypothetical protein